MRIIMSRRERFWVRIATLVLWVYIGITSRITIVQGHGTQYNAWFVLIISCFLAGLSIKGLYDERKRRS